MKKEKKEKFIDDGHTIVNMDIDGMPHRVRKQKDSVYVTKEEKKAIIKAGLLHYLPIMFGVILCFFLVMLLILWWLS